VRGCAQQQRRRRRLRRDGGRDMGGGGVKVRVGKSTAPSRPAARAACAHRTGGGALADAPAARVARARAWRRRAARRAAEGRPCLCKGRESKRRRFRTSGRAATRRRTSTSGCPALADRRQAWAPGRLAGLHSRRRRRRA
jgi:hypothetical protein